MMKQSIKKIVKNKMVKVAFAVATFCVCMVGVSGTAYAKKAASSTNANAEGSSNSVFAKTKTGYERAEWLSGKNSIVVEKYTEGFKLTSQKYIKAASIAPKNCPVKSMVFCGLYEGSKYNFVVTGRNNPKESTSLYVLRVTKFSKSWSKLGALDLQCKKYKKSNETMEIYSVSSVAAIEELNGVLWISLERTGFDDGDGLHHQGKLNVNVDEEKMKYLGDAGDFSHSWDHFMTVCNNHVYELNSSDGARGAYLIELDQDRYEGGWTDNFLAGGGWTKDETRKKCVEVEKYYTMKRNGAWSYGCYASATGIASSEASKRVLSVGCGINHEAVETGTEKKKDSSGNTTEYGTSNSDDFSYNVWIRSTDVSTDEMETEGHLLTCYDDNKKINVSNPKIGKINDHKFLVVWKIWELNDNDSNYLNYVFVNEYGEAVSKVYKMNGYLSDVPLINDGKGNIVWYSTNNGYPCFYKIKQSGAYTVKQLYAMETGFQFYNKGYGLTFEVTSKSHKSLEVSVVDYKDIPANRNYYGSYTCYVPSTVSYKGVQYKVTSVGAEAFKNQKNLGYLSLSSTITSIGANAFYGCTNMREMGINSKNMKNVNKYAFAGLTKSTVIYVPKEKKTAYKKLISKSFKGTVSYWNY